MNTLGLDDDLDGVEIVRSLEQAFDVAFTADDVTPIYTVGEFYDLLLRKIPQDASARKCASAMAFYRLRSALADEATEKLTPSSDIGFLEQRGARSSFARIAQKTGLQLPSPVLGRVGWSGCLVDVLAVLAGVGLVLAHWPVLSWPMALCGAAFVAGFVLVRVDQGVLPEGCRTLGNLSRQTASLSFGRLVKAGARHGADEVWSALLDLLSVYALPRADITRDTILLQIQFDKQRKAAQAA